MGVGETPGLTIEHIERWTDEAAHALMIATGTDDDEASIAADVNANRASLYRINGGDAWAVFRLDEVGGRREFVVVAFEGVGLLRLCPFLIEAARSAGAVAIRFHTDRPALARMVRRFGAVERERVYEVVI